MLASTVVALMAMGSVSNPGIVPREFRAVWVATVDNIDWPSKPGLPVEQQKAELDAIVDQCSQLGINAIVFQIRPMCDALYESKLEPWSWYLTGEQGKDPGYDPFERLIQRAHSKNIEVHAWFNPYRAKHPSMKGDLAPSHVGAKGVSWVPKYGTHLWMNPGAKEAQQQTLKVVRDVVKRYDVDGIHMDDYFYPYPVTEPNATGKQQNVPFPDSKEYDAYVQSGGPLNLEDWRRQNVDTLVQAIYKETKAVKPWVKFGISPFGIYRPGYPATVRAGFDQFSQLYADPLKWFQNGWCDYLAPQLYWKIGSPQPFPDLLAWWNEKNTKGIHLWPGLFTSQTNTSAAWPVEEISNQIGLIRGSAASGHIHFSYKAIPQNPRSSAGGSLRGVLKAVYSGKALVPASPWLSSGAPAKPSLTVTQTSAKARLDWSKSNAKNAYQWVLVEKVRSQWRIQRVFDRKETSTELEIPSDREAKNAFRLVALDRAGNESVAAMVVIK